MIPRLPRVLLGAAAALVSLTAASPAAGHEPAWVDDTYLQGVFAPFFIPPEPGTYDLPPLGRVRPFVLADARGRRVSTAVLMQGKAAVVSFIYTTCSERLGCPLAGATLRQVQDRLLQEGLADRTVLVSISFDPARDSPAQLARYARAFGARSPLWQVLAPPSQGTLGALLSTYGQDRARIYDGRGRFTGRYRHVLKVFLVDPAGRIRNVYSAGFLVPQVVMNDLKTVLAEGE